MARLATCVRSAPKASTAAGARARGSAPPTRRRPARPTASTTASARRALSGLRWPAATCAPRVSGALGGRGWCGARGTRPHSRGLMRALIATARLVTWAATRRAASRASAVATAWEGRPLRRARRQPRAPRGAGRSSSAGAGGGTTRPPSSPQSARGARATSTAPGGGTRPGGSRAPQTRWRLQGPTAGAIASARQASTPARAAAWPAPATASAAAAASAR
mmetsp:Transcript_18487/g.44458  ORF Transcript_18487/g.44458 Transcript_18487/m.44458 type:complete len:221 (-) Transcript_18487:1229-1891(-)